MEARDSFCFPKNTKNPNPSPIGKKFGFCCCGAPRKTSTRCVLVFLFVCTMEGARTRRRRTAPQAISPVGCCLELRVAAPSIRLVPWVALASCWPLPQQLLLASATGRSRRCCRSQWLGMSTVEAVDRKISWLFCFVSHGCTVSARFLHGRCFPCPIM